MKEESILDTVGSWGVLYLLVVGLGWLVVALDPLYILESLIWNKIYNVLW